MAGTTHDLWILGTVKSSEREDGQCQHTTQRKPRRRRRSHDLLWKEYLRDPSQWWDNRSSKVDPAYPDFKHKVSKESLWIDGWYNPSWVGEELRRRGLATPAHAQVIEPHDTNEVVRNDEVTAFVALLRACAKNKDLQRGTKIHDDILRKGLLEKCADALIVMYAKCGALAKAKELLDTDKSRNVVSWTALIAGYARQGQGHDALNCFEQMRHEGLSPDAVTFACILKACGSIKAPDKGEQIHDEIAKQGLLGNDIVLGNALVDMYAKCGAMEKAARVLEELPSRDVISWNALITGYVQQGQGEQALNCFEEMQHEGVSPDGVTFVCILKACATIGAINKGKQIHDVISRQGLLNNNIVLGTALVDMYAKCGALPKAQQVLEELPFRDVVSWNALIAGYAHEGQGEQALLSFRRMRHEGLSPDAVTFTCVLKACGAIGAVDKGKQIHDEISRKGLLGRNIVVGTALVDMYAKCGALTQAQQVLEELHSRDVVAWNALITGYTLHGQGEQTLNCYERMLHEGFSPDAVTYACVLKACGTIGASDKGEQIHDEIARQGLLGNIMLGNAVVDMYVKCGALAKAQQVLDQLPFRDVLSWNALIAGYVEQDQGEKALKCFEQMQHEGLSPSAVTFACVLKACGTTAATDMGEQIHEEIARQGLLESNIVLGNAIVDMYSRCGALSKAQQVLKELPSRDVFSWTALIAGYVEQGQGEQALNCFEQVWHEDLAPDAVILAYILKACGIIGAVDKGEQIHVEIIRLGLLGDNIVLGNALVDMYAKCGAFVKAQRVLQELPSRDVVSWSALIIGFAQHGQGEQALNCLEQMRREGLSPDSVLFSCLLNACSHLGLVEDGYMYFVDMSIKYGMKPDIEHYTCMVDLFGRAGHLDKAVRVIQEMPSSDYSAVWSALLSACQKWGDVNVGRWAFKQAMQVDKSDATAYVLMANIYAAAGMREDAENIDAMRMEIEAQKMLA